MKEPFGLDLGTLLSYHKQEGSEEMTYITIIFTIVLGVLGYIGSAKRIEPQVRITIAVIFAIFLYTFISALVSSLEVHSALHEEIRNFALVHPEMFIGHENSRLYVTLAEEVKPHDPFGVIWMGAGLGLIVVLGLLTIGEGRLFSFPRIIKTKPRRAIDNV